jgi:hypothetical protein
MGARIFNGEELNYKGEKVTNKKGNARVPRLDAKGSALV